MVRSDSETSDLLDPLVGYSSLSLFPLSFKPDIPKFDSLGSHLKAMVLRSPDKLLKQAKTILHDSFGVSKIDKTTALTSEDTTYTVPIESEKDAQERRPSLGLKRAKFSAKPMPSQPAVSLEPSMDIDKLKDPEEFFAAFERMENAKKELQRLRGQPLMDLDQNLSSLSPRRRRPSLLGKSATYTHRSYSSPAMGDNGETLLSSQMSFESNKSSPAPMDVLSETNVVNFLQHARAFGSTSTVNGKVTELDELLSCDYEGLDEAGVLNLLQEKLHIKPVDIGKPSLPDLLAVRRRESETSCEALPNMNDSIFLSNGLNKAITSEPLGVGIKMRESSVYPQVSPEPSKSPLASISLLNRHISKLTSAKDPFSALNIDSSPARISSLERLQRKKSYQIDAEDRSLVSGEETTALASPPPTLEAHGASPNREPKERLDEASQPEKVGTREDFHEFGRPLARGREGIPVSSEDLPISAVKDVAPATEPKEQEDEAAATGDSAQGKLKTEGSLAENSSVNGVDERGTGVPSNAEDIYVAQPNEETVRSSKRKVEERMKREAPSQAKASKERVEKAREVTAQSNAPVSEETGSKRRKVDGSPPRRSKREELRRRQSLCEAGTRWEAGVRRSTRIRMRPLEYWRGERFLYGRVHKSLVTVIGVKYASPSKEAGQRSIKVKSFVSDKFKDLVDLAALH